MEVVLLIGFIIISYSIIWIYKKEKSNYNNGFCPKCKTPLRFIDRDYNGSKLYKCPKCGYTVWTSYFF